MRPKYEEWTRNQELLEAELVEGPLNGKEVFTSSSRRRLLTIKDV